MRRLLLLGVLVALALSVAGAAGSAGSGQARWLIRDLGDVGGGGRFSAQTWQVVPSFKIAINNRGEIAFTGAAGAFLWRDGKLNRLGFLPGGASGETAALNDQGQVVGWSGTHRGDEWPHAVLWQQGSVTDLGTLAERQPGGPKGSARSWASALNDQGVITGRADVRGRVNGFVWQAGRMRDLGTLGGSAVIPRAIANDGRIIGESRSGKAFLWQNGRMRKLTTPPGDGESDAVALNERGQIIGVSPMSAGDRHAVLWEHGMLRDLGTLPGLRFSAAVAINAQAQVIGASSDNIGVFGVLGRGPARGFLWENGKIRDLGDLGGGASIPEAINGQGQIVGWSNSRGHDRAFLWQDGHLTDLGDLGGGQSFAAGINDKSQVVGWSMAANGRTHAVLWTLRPGT